jgi:hypothetical protein
MRYRTAIVVSALAGLGLVAPTSAQAETLTPNARADAYTLKSSATRNFRTAITLRVREPGCGPTSSSRPPECLAGPR